MRDAILVCLLAACAPCCGMRTRGIELGVDLRGAEGSAAAALDVSAIELVACDDLAARMASALLASGIAHAHDTTSAARRVELPAGASWSLAPTPGTYCAIRVVVADVETFAGQSDARDIELPLLDAEGAPVRVLLARASDRADVAITLGAFTSDDTPTRALSRMVSGASAVVAAP